MRFAAIAAVIVLAFGAASYAVYDSRQRAREQRQTVCQEIEKLKTAQRERAIENYNRLDQNLEILRLKRTPKIVRVARQSRDRELRRFAARECP